MIKKLKLDEEDAQLLFEELEKLGISYDASEFTIETDNDLKTIRNRTEMKPKSKWKSSNTSWAVKEDDSSKDWSSKELDK